jgi:hypothetical protein
MTVSWRRSALGAEAGAAAGEGGGVSACDASRPPQELQKFAPTGFSCPQAAQPTGCGAPHWLQKRLPAGNAAPHWRQAKGKATRSAFAPPLPPQ